MTPQINSRVKFIMSRIESYRTAGGREEHHARKEALEAHIEQLVMNSEESESAQADAHRLALELECLLLDTKDLSVVSKWWASANEALELHRNRVSQFGEKL